ncbi:MAG: fibronectin type III domain-containing protein [Lachnospirales bacterium]
MKKLSILALIFSLIMCVSIFADTQNRITEMVINNIPNTISDSYNFTISWENPGTGAKTSDNIDDPVYAPSAKGDAYNAQGYVESTGLFGRNYTLQWRNTTAGKSYNQTDKIVFPPTVDGSTEIAAETETYTYDGPLDGGSIYSYKVVPNHRHRLLVGYDNNGDAVYEWANAEYSDIEKDSEYLYLTDIGVNADKSTPNSFTVTWSNPTYDGKNVFDGYRLTYAIGGDEVDKVPTVPFSDVAIDDSKLVFNSNGTVTYTFDASDIEIGRMYALAIEPLVNGSPLRETINAKVNIDGVNYPIAFSSREYRANNAYVRPELYLTAEGTDRIRLYWDDLSSSGSTITRITVQERPEGTELWTDLGTIEGLSASTVNFWYADYPKYPMEYRIIIEYAGDPSYSVYSNLAYYDPTHNDFDPYRPIIHNATTDSTSFEMFWQAFLRDPYTDEEVAAALEEYNNQFLDENLSYRIWVTDDAKNLYDARFEESYLFEEPATSFNSEDYPLSSKTNTLVYKTTINNYVSMVNGATKFMPLEDNKVYYIKILAIRDKTGEVSEYEYYSVFIPKEGEIIIDPLTMGTPPLRIKEDDNGVAEITTETYTIEWDGYYYEAYDEKTDNWYAIIGVDKNGNIVYGKDAEKLDDRSKVLYLYDEKFTNLSLANAKKAIQNTLITLGAKNEEANLLPVRDITIDGVNYEIYTAEFNHVEESGGYNPYYESIVNEEWTSITPTVDGQELNYIVTDSNAPTPGKLNEDTLYITYLRMYIEKDGKRLYADEPSHVMATTLKDRGDIIVVPTAVYLEISDYTDTEITVKWEYSQGLDYELKYSELPSDYTAGGISVDNETLEKDGKIVVENGKEYIYYTIKGFFPDTEYYFWIRSYNGNATSDWSSPENCRTLDMIAPNSPRGLGPISKDSMEIVNKENGLELMPIDMDYIIVEWLRVGADKNENIVGITDAGEGNGNQYIGANGMVSTFGAKFNALIGNKEYYFRAKTRRTITKEGMGVGSETYSYIVEVADNKNFTDSIQIEVPYYGLVEEGPNLRTKDSHWSESIRLRTGSDPNEYDGDINPDLYPLPEEDFDITIEDGKLIYEFKHGETGADGKPNYNADQRFIAKVIDQGLYDYAIDLTAYNGKHYKEREVRIPFSIVDALGEYKTTLSVKADNIIAKFDMGNFQKISKNNNLNFGRGSTINLNFNEDTAKDIKLLENEYYSSKAQKINATMNMPDRTHEISALPSKMNVEMILSNRYTVYEDNLKSYKLDGTGTKWSTLPSEYNITENRYTFDTSAMGTYSVIGKGIGKLAENSVETNLDDYYTVNTFINIEDINVYEPDKEIFANQFNNIIYGVVKNSSSVKINQSVNNTALQELGRSKLLVSGSYVTREVGIASLVRLYELKTGAVSEKTSLKESGFEDISTVDDKYKVSLEKAINIGFLDNDENIEGKSNMKMNDFMYMLAIVLQDM